MNIQFVTDSSGKQQAVQIPIKEWKAFEKKFDRVQKKLEFLTELREAAKEVKSMREGKLKEKTIQQFLDEL